MRLYTLALLIALCVSLSLFVGKIFTHNEIQKPEFQSLSVSMGSPGEISYSQEIAANGQKQKASSVEERLPNLRVVPVSSTPDPSTVAVVIQYPKQKATVRGNPIWVQVRIDGYPLANDSEFDRADEIFNSKLGQTVRVVVDNEPFFPFNGPSIQPFNEDGFYYDQNYKFPITIPLEEGFHTIRVFLARSFGESLKGERAFQASYFYVGETGGEGSRAFLTQPYLTYNEPSELSYYTADKPILLDFYLTNCDLSTDGYKVRMSIDGAGQRTLTSWQPYYLYGLPKGKHTIRLELIDSKNKLVPGPFNDTLRTIVVH